MQSLIPPMFTSWLCSLEWPSAAVQCAIAATDRISTHVRVCLAQGGRGGLKHAAGLLAGEPLEFRGLISFFCGCTALQVAWCSEGTWALCGERLELCLPSFLWGPPCSFPIFSLTIFLGLESSRCQGQTQSPFWQPSDLLTQPPATIRESVWKPLLCVLGARDALWKARTYTGVWPVKAEPSWSRVTGRRHVYAPAQCWRFSLAQSSSRTGKASLSLWGGHRSGQPPTVVLETL